MFRYRVLVRGFLFGPGPRRERVLCGTAGAEQHSGASWQVVDGGLTGGGVGDSYG
jgi:hypothetical protein